MLSNRESAQVRARVRERIARIARHFQGQGDLSRLIDFGLRVRRQTLREERERNKRVKDMFAKEPE